MTRHNNMYRTVLEGKVNKWRSRGKLKNHIWSSNIKEWTGQNYVDYVEAIMKKIDDDETRVHVRSIHFIVFSVNGRLKTIIICLINELLDSKYNFSHNNIKLF